jgi:hypothetical protein
MVTKSVKAEETPSRYIMLLIDQSGSMTGTTGRANDPDDRRLRFSRFLVKYLLAFYPKTEVGLMGFVASPKPEDTISLIPIKQWSAYDLTIWERLTKGTASENTSFVSALNAVGKLFPDTCSTSSDPPIECSIVIFSDGVLQGGECNNPNRVKDSLSKLKQNGIRGLLVAFAGRSTDIPISTDRSCQMGPLETWKDQWEVEVICDGDLCNASEMRAQDIYEQLFRSLDVDKPLSNLIAVEFEQTTSLPLPVYPDQRSARLFLLPDSSLIEEWNVITPSVQVGNESWWLWLEPPPSEIRVDLKVNDKSPQSLVYYTYNNQDRYPISLVGEVMPDSIAPGQSVKIDGWLSAGGRVIVDGCCSVQATIDGKTIPLIKKIDGHFSGESIILTGGVHKVIFHPVFSPEMDFPSLHDVHREIYVETAPRLQMNVSSGQQLGQNTVPLTITVSVENYENVLAIEPVLMEVEDGEKIAWSSWDDGIYVAHYTVPLEKRITLQASISAGYTVHGVHFGSQVVEVQHIYSPIPIPEPVIIFDSNGAWKGLRPWMAFPGLLLLIPVTILLAVEVRRRRRQKVFDDAQKEALKIFSGKSLDIVQVKRIFDILDDERFRLEDREMEKTVRKAGKIVSQSYRTDLSIRRRILNESTR